MYDIEQQVSYDVSCISCGDFNVQPENTWFDEKGFGYSTRLCKCPQCGKVVIIEYIEDYGCNLNNDERFYTYK